MAPGTAATGGDLYTVKSEVSDGGGQHEPGSRSIYIRLASTCIKRYVSPQLVPSTRPRPSAGVPPQVRPLDGRKRNRCHVTPHSTMPIGQSRPGVDPRSSARDPQAAPGTRCPDRGRRRSCLYTGFPLRLAIHGRRRAGRRQRQRPAAQMPQGRMAGSQDRSSSLVAARLLTSWIPEIQREPGDTGRLAYGG